MFNVYILIELHHRNDSAPPKKTLHYLTKNCVLGKRNIPRSCYLQRPTNGQNTENKWLWGSPATIAASTTLFLHLTLRRKDGRVEVQFVGPRGPGCQVSFIHDGTDTPLKFQEFCCIKTGVMITSVGRPTWLGQISQDPIPRWSSTEN